MPGTVLSWEDTAVNITDKSCLHWVYIVMREGRKINKRAEKKLLVFLRATSIGAGRGGKGACVE